MWNALRARWPADHSAYSEFMFGDRCDAELMLGWQRIRFVSEGRPMSFPNIFWLSGDEWEPRYQPAGGQL